MNSSEEDSIFVIIDYWFNIYKDIFGADVHTTCIQILLVWMLIYIFCIFEWGDNKKLIKSTI